MDGMGFRRCWLVFVLLLAGLIGLPGHILAQDDSEDELSLHPARRFWHITSEDGLVQNNVQAIFQDRFGFMWFGTESGLSRYDGYNYLTFVVEPDNANSLIHNFVSDIAQAPDGSMWLSTEGGGLHQLDPATLEITATLADEIETRAENRVNLDRHATVTVAPDGIVWAGGGGPVGLTRYDPISDEATSIFPEIGAGSFLFDVEVAPDDTLWLANRIGVVRFDPVEQRFDAYDFRPFDESNVTTIMLDTDGTVWAGGTRGLYRLDPTADQFRPIPLGASVNDMMIADDGNLWLGTADGLYVLDRADERVLLHERPYAGVPDSLRNGSIQVIFQDESGKIWMGGENGIDVFDPLTERFMYLRQETQDAPASLESGEIHALHAQDDAVLWVSAGGYLHRLDFAENEVDAYELDDDEDTEEAAIGDIVSITTDQSGDVWLGGVDAALARFDPETETFENITAQMQAAFSSGFAAVEGIARRPDGGRPPPGGEHPQPPPRPGPNQDEPPRAGSPFVDQRVIGLFVDDADYLWIAMEITGIYRMDPSRTQIDHFPAELFRISADDGPGGGAPIDAGVPPLTAVAFEPDGSAWLGTRSGVHYFDVATGEFLRIRESVLPAGAPPPPVPGDVSRRREILGPTTVVETMYLDDSGNVWIGTRNGLIRHTIQADTFDLFTTDDGLPTNYVVGIRQSENGDLWISSKRGLSRFDPSTEQFVNYSVADGLQSVEFNRGLVARMDDDRMVFGGVNGLNVFYPGDITPDDFVPRVALDNFEIAYETVVPGDDSQLERPIWVTDSVTLEPGENIFTFEFVALNYAFGRDNQYRYRMDGLDSDWNVVDSSRRFATYTNLSAGDYRFRVQAASNDGAWDDSLEVTIALTVLPNWWETDWFRLLAAGIVLVSAVGTVRWRVGRVQRQNARLQREVDKQTHELTMRTKELQASEKELRQARDSAEAANHAKSAFLANMSHELRSPLNAILGFTQLAHRDRSLRKDVRDNLGIVMRSGEHLLSLINQVLDLSKVEAGQMSTNQRDFDLYRLLDDLEDMYILMAQEKHLTYTVRYAPDVPRYIRTDMTKLRQTLINLTSNALKFTRTGSIAVTVQLSNEATPDGKGVRLEFSVADTGAGIPDEELNLLFEAFAQTSTGRKTQEGTGLGLAISQRFVRLLGGDIQVESAVGKGTTFTFNIVCTVASGVEIDATTMRRNIIGLADGQPRYRILVVDDKWTNRKLLIKLLVPLGFEMKEAENGKEAVEMAQSFAPHLIFMDIRMPVMDGIEATQAIRDLPIGDTTRIVALTASAFDENRADVIAAGCDDFMRKPVQMQPLFDMLATYLGVTYVYEESEDDPTTVAMPAGEFASAMQGVPDGLVDRLIGAVELGDVATINRMIDEIAAYAPSAAETLRSLANQFQFSQLLSMVKDQETT